MRHYEGKGSYYEKFEAIMKNNGLVIEDDKIVFNLIDPYNDQGEIVWYGVIAKGFRKPYAEYRVYFNSMRGYIDGNTLYLDYEDKAVSKRVHEARQRKVWKQVQAEMAAEMAN